MRAFRVFQPTSNAQARFRSGSASNAISAKIALADFLRASERVLWACGGALYERSAMVTRATHEEASRVVLAGMRC